MTRREAIRHTLAPIVVLSESRARPMKSVREAAIIRHRLDLWEVRYYDDGVWKSAAVASISEAQAVQRRYLLADLS